MPIRDGSGPYGNGPKTGRRLGYCVGNETEAQITMNNVGQGAGYGRMRGRASQHRGRGFGAMHFPLNEVSGIKEKTLVQNEINILKDQLAALEERLKNIKE